MPTVTLQGNASRSRDSDPTLGTFGTDQASIPGQLTPPIYDGGMAASQTRQAKEIAPKAGWCSIKSATRPAPRRSAPGSPMKAPRSR